MSARPIYEDRILLKTSRLSCFFEPRTGFLRQVIVDGCEVIRAIYGAVRNEFWETIQPEIVLNRLEAEDEHFFLEFQAECLSADIAFSWIGTIEGSDRTISFKFAGEAKSSFRKNRIGLCLLHPIRECAGKRCRVRDTGDHWAETEFPVFVAPHQPFKNLGALTWEPMAGLEAIVTFTGEVFETEDQRNWTDASFKTYCTPLERPYPAEIEAGTRVNQSISVELKDRETRSRLSSGPERDLIEVIDQDERSLPSLGLCVSSYGSPLLEVERARLAALHLDHLRVDVRFSEARWRESFEQAVADAERIGARVRPALFLSNREDLRLFAETINDQILRDCLVFHESEASTSEQWLELASKLLPRVTVVGGTNAYFAELNRAKPTAGFPAAFSINPQVHAFDDLSLMENLEAQPEAVLSARRLGGSDVYISPVTLRPRFNPNARSLPTKPAGVLPFSVDPRQRTLLAAAWTVGSLARLLYADGTNSLTYYETTGWKGLFEAGSGNPLPDLFGSTPGEIFPIYHVFHALSNGTALFPVINPVPQTIAAIAFRKQEGRAHLLLANLRPEPSTARIRLPAERVEVQILHEQSLFAATQGILPDPDILNKPGREARLALPGYAFAVLRCN